MPRAQGNDLCEIFGFAPDDNSEAARKQWKSQDCPFIGGTCIKHSHPGEEGRMVVYGSCSVTNRKSTGVVEEVIICPQRFYADQYKSLQRVIHDAIGTSIPIYTVNDYKERKKLNNLPDDYVVLIGQRSGAEISLSKRDPLTKEVVKLSFDWVIAQVIKSALTQIIPCEVQSIDTTGNYHSNWNAYSKEASLIPT